MSLENYVTYTTIKVDKEVKQKLLVLKYKYMFKSFNELLRFMAENFDKYMELNTAKPKSIKIEEKARELIIQSCLELGEESRFFPIYVVKRYKISEKELVEYFERLDEEILCEQILKDESK